VGRSTGERQVTKIGSQLIPGDLSLLMRAQRAALSPA